MGFLGNIGSIFNGDSDILFFILVFLLLFNGFGKDDSCTDNDSTILFFIILFLLLFFNGDDCGREG